MKTSVVVSMLVTASLVGCASNQPQLTPVSQAPVATTYVSQAHVDEPVIGGKVYKLRNYDGPEAMDSLEVNQAKIQCINHKMRPEVIYLSVRTEQGKVPVPVSVHCEPF